MNVAGFGRKRSARLRHNDCCLLSVSFGRAESRPQERRIVQAWATWPEGDSAPDGTVRDVPGARSTKMVPEMAMRTTAEKIAYSTYKRACILMLLCYSRVMDAWRWWQPNEPMPQWGKTYWGIVCHQLYNDGDDDVRQRTRLRWWDIHLCFWSRQFSGVEPS